MTRKFSLVAFTTAIFVTAIIVMVFARDIVWPARIDQDAAALARAQHSAASGLAIHTAVIDRLNKFRGQTDPEGDVTLVVVKLLELFLKRPNDKIILVITLH